MIFPRTIFVDKNDIDKQIDHIISEMAEVIEAAKLGTVHDLARELVDLQHSASTALHILKERHGILPDKVMKSVIAGNAERGYYGTGGAHVTGQCPR